MVGVPGRSTACSTCRARKKGCDQQKPSCGQCIRLGIRCGGYYRNRVFVNTDAEKARSTKSRFVPKAYSAEHSIADLSACGKDLTSTAQYIQYLDHFWNAILPNSEACSKTSAGFSHIGWSLPIYGLCQQSELVRLAVLANALGVLGQQSGQFAVSVEGLRIYGKVLHLFAKSLALNREGIMDNLLAVAMMLGQFEVLQGARNLREIAKSGIRWLRHTAGAEAIILGQHPRYYSEGTAHYLFINCRLYLTTLHIRDRKSSPFSTSEWKTIPWTKTPKDTKNELIDILVELPAILQDIDELADTLHGLQGRHSSLYQSLLHKCSLCDSSLQIWASTSGATVIDFAQDLIASKRDIAMDRSSEAIAKAHLGLLYWTTCLILYQNLHDVLTAIDKEPSLPRWEPRQYVRNIMHLVPYFQHSSVGGFFINMVSFPAIVAMRFVERNDPPDEMSEECRLVLTGFKGKYAQQMERFIGGWPWRFEYHRRLRQQLRCPHRMRSDA